ncbi:EAP30/Vps36 family protein [Dictyocaulus viviparus]|uniref:Vacuolar-sorting protein SNF8 n=1 Tax=Dictyocaulus viviparus TaxID=29172 RepID=A0A0D8XVL8_DICVI|nr:EAP30/Vps36 family protein [Dictyocaulus viviparus]
MLLFCIEICADDVLKVRGGWETDVKDIVGRYGPCNIERHNANDLTQKEFLTRFAYNEPVIIYNVNNDEFRRLTARKKMMEDWKDYQVTLNSANTYSYTRIQTSFGEYVEYYLKPQNIATPGNETMYLFGDIDQELWDPLLRSYKLPQWSLPGHTPALSFGLAGAGTGVPFHFHGPGFAEVIHGSKRWFLYPFEQKPDFDPDQSTLEWYLRKYPLLLYEELPLECLLSPGEIIYFPDRWWHATLNSETSVFVSTFLSPQKMASRRRAVGIAAVQRKQETQAKFNAKGEQMASEQLQMFSKQLEEFAVRLEQFAYRHRDEIRKNSQFRRHFQEMCASVGVDPLASGKGFWAEKLGFGDFYYELAVQIVEVCLSTNHFNGGIMTVEEIRNRLVRSRSRTRKETITTDDILRSVDKLKVLGSGFELVPLGGGRFLVQSVPGELSMDHSRVLQLAEDAAYITKELIIDRLRWNGQRAQAALDHLVKEGLAWIDEQATDTIQYWVPSLFLQQHCHSSSNTSVSESIHSMSVY